MKARIVEHLGQSAIILPALVREGLAANDRAKVRMGSVACPGTMNLKPRIGEGSMGVPGAKVVLIGSVPPSW
jgi:hypothetical protein